MMFVLALAGQQCLAADWPMYRCDAARSAHTSEPLPDELSLRWTYHAAHTPRPAWPSSERMRFDRAYHTVIAGGTLYFGSSADGKVYALDAASGIERWTFFTGGPVRFSPAVWQDRVFVGSDDGNLYCLAGDDGRLLWKRRGGPDEEMILGNDHMVSRWPARGGPVVVGATVYFGAGIWPSDGVYLYALDAATGKLLWVNENSGSIEMDQPHSGARAKSGVASQGYLVASDSRLFVPTGRSVPAAFERAHGAFQYLHLQKYGRIGSATATVVESMFFNSGLVFDAKTGLSIGKIGNGPIAVWSEGIIRSTSEETVVYRWAEKQKPDRRGKTPGSRRLETFWSVEGVPGGMSLIVAGDAFVSGGPKGVTVIDRKSRKARWSAEVDGDACGLAVADGRLYVSTDQGTIYCFDGSRPKSSDITAGRLVAQRDSAGERPQPLGPYGENALYASAAEEIIRKTGIVDGYCLDIGCGNGALAYELAKRTQLHIYAFDSDPRNVALARRKLDSAGFYGVRVTVHHTGRIPPYPNSFANLVVSARSVTKGAGSVPLDEMHRMQRPYGGVACVGWPSMMRKTVRGALSEAGEWTHQYCDAANTSCSTDTLVKSPLSMLWFRDVDLDMPSRHGRAPSPLFENGRLIVEGLNALRAVDAYNGRTLWQFPLPGVLKEYDAEHNLGTAGTGSNVCLSDGAVYLRTGRRCLRIDAATGKQLIEIDAPNCPDGRRGTWGYLACQDDTLFGSLVNDAHIVGNPRWQWAEADMSKMFTESFSLFAMDALTGKMKWTYRPEYSIRHNAIAIGDGRVYLIDRPLAAMDNRLNRRGHHAEEHATGTLVALDIDTGRILWKQADDIFGTLLALSVKHSVLLMSYHPVTDRLPSERGGRLAGIHTANGQRLWDRQADYVTRPLINDRTIYAQAGDWILQTLKDGRTAWNTHTREGGAWDLLTGAERPLAFTRSYGCGQLSGCSNLLVFRSATLGYFDLSSKREIENYGGMRPGCWINAIPAGGLLLVPDATSGCACSYLNRAWIALGPCTK